MVRGLSVAHISGDALTCRNLPYRLLKYFGRLTTLDEVATIDDDRGHGGDAVVLPMRFGAADFFGEFARFEHHPRGSYIEPDLADQIQ